MVKLLIIADDFTGALDTGIQFAKRGISTQVFNDFHFNNDEIHSNTEVLVIDTETRFLSKEAAYESVKMVSVWAKSQGIEIIFKKTDSALRGNIGAEIEAVIDHDQDAPLFFIPGHPEIDRVIQNGTSYISKQLLENSVFGTDPFEPVTQSFVPDIMKEQSDVMVDVIRKEETIDWETLSHSKVLVCDSMTVDDIDDRLNELIQHHQIKYLAGCSALADCLADKLSFNRTERTSYNKTDGLYIACGSLNEITKRQVEYAEKHGFYRKNLSPVNKLDRNFFDTGEGQEIIRELRKVSQENKQMIVDTFEDEIVLKDKATNGPSEEDGNARFTIAEAHGRLAKEFLNKEMDYTILMTGGDTLMGLMKAIGTTQIKLICEIETGVVLSLIEYKGQSYQIISKSGGFGTEDVFCRISEKILK